MAATETATRASRALDDLYRAHVGEVYRYAYAVLGNHADAEDVTQTTFVNALRALERGDRPRKPSNWLITIAHNVVRQRFRTMKARPAEVELDHEIAAGEATHDGPTLDELVKALQRIPPTQREAIVMRELEGRSYKEIQEILELTPAALEMLLFRARRSLAEELENVVTCEQAELALSRRLDGRLSRKERRRLQEHLDECPSCARLDATRRKRGHAFRALAVLPLPLSLTFFKGAPSASAAAGLPTIGGAVTAAGGSGTTAGGLLAGGVAVKAAVLAAAVASVGAVGYVGVEQVAGRGAAKPPPATVSSEPAAPQARSAPAAPKAAPTPRASTPPSAAPTAASALRPDAGAPATATVTTAPETAGKPAAEERPSRGKSAEAHARNAARGKPVAKPAKPPKKAKKAKKATRQPPAVAAPAAAKRAEAGVAPAPATTPAQAQPEAEEVVTPSPEPERSPPEGAGKGNGHGKGDGPGA